MLKGRITEWNPERGFGFVESSDNRVFLHLRDFARRHKLPEVGDVVTFELGHDKQGRPCAQKAEHVNDGGQITSATLIQLALLLGAPICAGVKLARLTEPWTLAAYAIGVSLLTYFAYAWDKGNARKKGQREPERLLHVMELMGGWPGAFVAQRYLRHKSSKLTYQYVFWLIVALHEFLAVDYLRNWAIVRAAWASLGMR